MSLLIFVLILIAVYYFDIAVHIDRANKQIIAWYTVSNVRKFKIICQWGK